MLKKIFLRLYRFYKANNYAISTQVTIWSKLISLTFFIACLPFPVGLAEAIILIGGFKASSLHAWIWFAILPGFGDSGTFHFDNFVKVIPSPPLSFHKPWFNSVKTTLEKKTRLECHQSCKYIWIRMGWSSYCNNKRGLLFHQTSALFLQYTILHHSVEYNGCTCFCLPACRQVCLGICWPFHCWWCRCQWHFPNHHQWQWACHRAIFFYL